MNFSQSEHTCVTCTQNEKQNIIRTPEVPMDRFIVNLKPPPWGTALLTPNTDQFCKTF